MTAEASIIQQPETESIHLDENGAFPNHPDWPLLVYRSVLTQSDRLEDHLVSVIRENGWGGVWINGVFGYHHYHSNAHELLAVLSGRAEAQFGGPGGPTVDIEAGDAAILPVGTAHKELSSSPDFRVMGAYPGSADYDLCYGKEGERPKADRRIAAVPRPTHDPFFGCEGPLLDFWE